MATNYNGAPTATQAPSPTPSLDNPVILSLPQDADAWTVANFYQALKALADKVEYLTTTQRGYDYVFNDDFNQSTLSLSNWTVTSGSPTLSSDEANGGYGAVTLSTSSATNVQVQTFNVANGTKDFRFSMRCRVAAMGGAGSVASCTLNFTNNGMHAQVYADQATGRWFALHDFVTPGVNVSYDLGVSYSTTTYDRVDIRSTGSQYQWIVNDVVKLTASTTVTSARVTNINLVSQRATSGTTTLIVDNANLWAKR